MMLTYFNNIIYQMTIERNIFRTFLSKGGLDFPRNCSDW